MRAWPVWMASPSGTPLSSRFRWDRAHFLSNEGFVVQGPGVLFVKDKLPCDVGV